MLEASLCTELHIHTDQRLRIGVLPRSAVHFRKHNAFLRSLFVYTCSAMHNPKARSPQQVHVGKRRKKTGTYDVLDCLHPYWWRYSATLVSVVLVNL